MNKTQKDCEVARKRETKTNPRMTKPNKEGQKENKSTSETTENTLREYTYRQVGIDGLMFDSPIKPQDNLETGQETIRDVWTTRVNNGPIPVAHLTH